MIFVSLIVTGAQGAGHGHYGLSFPFLQGAWRSIQGTTHTERDTLIAQQPCFTASPGGLKSPDELKDRAWTVESGSYQSTSNIAWHASQMISPLGCTQPVHHPDPRVVGVCSKVTTTQLYNISKMHHGTPKNAGELHRYDCDSIQARKPRLRGSILSF